MIGRVGAEGETEKHDNDKRKKGARSFFIEVNLFVVDLERHKGMMRGVIEEKTRNLSSWVWMGSISLGFFLEGIEISFLDLNEEQYI